MPRFTITVPDDLDEWLTAATGDNGAYDSKSEAARAHLEQARRIDQLDADLDDLLARAERVAELEQQVERLENEKATLIRDREEKQELARYVEEQRSIEQYRARREQMVDEATILQRVKWKLTGVPVDGEDSSD